jgi:hypothetical protein
MSRRVFLLGLGLALVALGLAVTDRALRPSEEEMLRELMRTVYVNNRVVDLDLPSPSALARLRAWLGW